MIRTLHILFIAIATLFLQGCAGGGYSFTQGVPDPNINTVSIQYFTNQAPLAKPTVSNAFTETLKDLFQTQTKLALVSKYGDLQFEGYISGYRTAPVAITGNETAAKTG
ncbi:MAG: LptE family protein [Flavobacteriales bacterium]|nr:LptE family protein [Flavobacteriales bacterium]